MKLIGLRLNKTPLIVELMWVRNEKRTEDGICQEVYKDYYFDINDIGKTTDIMEYFVEKCDPHMSPQSLFECNGVDYFTLIKDYEANSDFDEVLDHIVKILDISLSDEDREYIRGIDISYPDTWEVQIELMNNLKMEEINGRN